MLVIEEAVALVDDLPQRLEVALRGVGVFFFIYTRGEKRQDAYDE
jgi:hypothetical protein